MEQERRGGECTVDTVDTVDTHDSPDWTHNSRGGAPRQQHRNTKPASHLTTQQQHCRGNLAQISQWSEGDRARERVSSCRHTIRLISAKIFYLLVKCNIFFRSAICIGNIACCLANCMFARVCLNIGTFYFTWILDSKLLLLGIQRSREDS